MANTYVYYMNKGGLRLSVGSGELSAVQVAGYPITTKAKDTLCGISNEYPQGSIVDIHPDGSHTLVHGLISASRRTNKERAMESQTSTTEQDRSQTDPDPVFEEYPELPGKNGMIDYVAAVSTFAAQAMRVRELGWSSE